jgi:hypothetical protein
MDTKIVKVCNMCGKKITADELVYSPELRPIGMAFDDTVQHAYYFFQHEVPGCHTSLLVAIEHLQDYISETIFPEKKTLTDCCEEHCVNVNDLSGCHQECYYAPFRRFLLEMIANKAVAKAEQKH